MSEHPVRCECGRPCCGAALDLTRDELYELRQAYPPERGFAVVCPGHEQGGGIVEETVSRATRFTVVRLLRPTGAANRNGGAPR